MDAVIIPILQRTTLEFRKCNNLPRVPESISHRTGIHTQAVPLFIITALLCLPKDKETGNENC